MAVTDTQLLEKGFRSSNWVQKNFDELAKKYEGKLIAVEDEEIIAVSDTMEDLTRQIERKGKNPAETYVTSFPPGDFIWVL
jgi:predicted Rossmann-fold nucleotide-binding protein